MAKELLTSEYVNECLIYDGDTGKLTWKVRPLHHFKHEWVHRCWNERWADTEAGWVDGSITGGTYLKVSISGENYKAHRVIWLIVNGKWPENLIDHINGNSLDNRIENLREADHALNSSNQKKRWDNKSGVTGVGWQKQMGKWYANGRHNNHLEHLGFYDDKFEAICARKSWEVSKGFHINHGRA
jgi:hypothetical protein